MHEKIVEREKLRTILLPLKKQGGAIVFTNGCFDLLHIGHVQYLSKAKEQGDYLVVGLNTDRSVREIKGKNRPIVPQEQRAAVLAALSVVDYVTLFDEPNPLATIQMIKPDVLVKGADWEKDDIVGRDAVEAAGGRVARIALTPEASTTGIIEKIVSNFCKGY